MILEDNSFARKVRREAMRLVEVAIRDKEVVKKMASDPIFFSALILGQRHTPYQTKFLNSKSKRIILRWPRQSGKTHSLAAYSIWYASTHPKSTTLIVAPTQRQSMILNDVIREFIEDIPAQVRRGMVKKDTRTIMHFTNKSRIVALPNSENLLRGYTAKLIILDEAAFFKDDETIFNHVLKPMLATTGGKMIVSSTPWGKKSQFYKINCDPNWELHHATWRDARDAGLYTTEWVEEVERTRETLPMSYLVEYEAEFTEDVDTWLSQDILAKGCCEEVEYISFNKQAQGSFYIGVDIGERVDYTAVAVLKKEGNTLDLIHMHRFPLMTSVPAALGYLKVLGERWRNIRTTYLDSTKHGDLLINDATSSQVPNPKGISFNQENKMEMAQIMQQRLNEGRLRLPYDRSLLDELNVEQFQLTKTGRIEFSHASGTHDDRFWALALAVYAAEKDILPSRPIVKGAT